MVFPFVSLPLFLSLFLPDALSLPFSLFSSWRQWCACSLKSKSLPVRLLRLCALRLSFPLLSPQCCAALHSSSLLCPHLHLSSFSFSFPSSSTCISLTLCALLPVVHCCALLRCLGKYSTISFFFAPELSALQLLVEEELDAHGAPGLTSLGFLGSV